VASRADGARPARPDRRRLGVVARGARNTGLSEPIVVNQGDKVEIEVLNGSSEAMDVRMYVLNAGPSQWSAFHVIGTVFDRTVIEGVEGRDAQTANLAPSRRIRPKAHR
jgi:hypothetical protein